MYKKTKNNLHCYYEMCLQHEYMEIQTSPNCSTACMYTH